MSNQGAGRYEIRFSGAACSGGDWSGAQVALITLNPNLAFRLRFHYRDHLGSSTVSRAYTPEYQTGIAGAATFNLKMSALGNQFVTLYAQPEKATNFTPFGKPMGDVNEEPNPRYTDHEFDAESGLNYMKGRYQLANFAKFNRPDPMRDWDWENPSSINLYQYVRNNPVIANDPSGLSKIGIVIRVGEWGLKMIRKTSRDEAKRAFRKANKDVKGSKTFSKKMAKRKGVGRNPGKPIEEVHGNQNGTGTPHFHTPDRRAFKGDKKGAHAFFEEVAERSSNSAILIPGVTIGQEVAGDNLVGELIDAVNPVGDVQDLVNVSQVTASVAIELGEVVAETAEEEVLEPAIEKTASFLEKAKEKIKDFIDNIIPDFRKKDDSEGAK